MEEKEIEGEGTEEEEEKDKKEEEEKENEEKHGKIEKYRYIWWGEREIEREVKEYFTAAKTAGLKDWNYFLLLQNPVGKYEYNTKCTTHNVSYFSSFSA